MNRIDHTRRTVLGAGLGAILTGQAAFAADPLKQSAESSNQLNVYSVLSNKAAAPLLEAFSKRHPGIDLRYDGDSGSTEIYERYLQEVSAGQDSADVMWSSAMDLQIDLVKRGHARKLALRGTENFPAWSHFDDSVWGTTMEPIGFVFNKSLMNPAEVPKTRAALTRWLNENRAALQGKVALFDIEKSGVGFQFIAWDYRYGPDADTLLEALGRVNPLRTSGTGEMLKAVHEGRCLMGYNVITSYALSRSRKDLQNLAVVYPQDYTVGLSRLMFISRHSRRPAAAQLWAEFVLSREGQGTLSQSLELASLHKAVEGVNTLKALEAKIGPALRPVEVNAALSKHLEPQQAAELRQRWAQAFGPAR